MILAPSLDRNRSGSAARFSPEGSKELAVNPLCYFTFNIERLLSSQIPLLHLKSAPLKGNGMIAARRKEALYVEPRERLHALRGDPGPHAPFRETATAGP